MLTKKYFEAWDPETLREGEQPPSYRRPYHEFILWVYMARTFLFGAGFTVLFFFLYIKVVESTGLSGWAIAVGGAAVLSWLWAVLTPYLLFWEWKNRPIIVDATNAKLKMVQTLPKRRRFLLAPFVSSSSDELVDLMKGYATPDQSVWQQWWVHCDTLYIPHQEPPMGRGRLINFLKQDRRKSDEVLTFRFVIDMAHINLIVEYVSSLERHSVRDQKDLLQQILNRLDAGGLDPVEKSSLLEELKDLRRDTDHSHSRNVDLTPPPAED